MRGVKKLVVESRIKAIKAEIVEVEENYRNGAELDGEPMYTEAEYYMVMAELEDELRALQFQLEGAK